MSDLDYAMPCMKLSEGFNGKLKRVLHVGFDLLNSE